ncbi:TPA: hypothetical protein ACTEIG_000271 [Streptococcus agalactiae]|uniref:hypothetical protein n=1 Tax=Streptococcus agalactiae TaxID=1311 RepID=UPI0002BA1883|nr:hypothetical protein [Streptococcus agalactiae]EPT58669.1 hypothetical protein SAG0058_02005 [Streptococcus agalactiae CCUG 37430]EPV00995.1 hypothetical protein SAG0324_02315 [Streptococcus agalactiae GB00300]EPW23636.1 hypothetical protein SAG0062_03440 [Streptococcus agalactiae CCUG 37739]EPW97677.1 hypothetical protein SAG0140_11130 [Streptococcus agalactiae MRI Z1-022]EQA30185.1 hypothetical protein SAG0142_01215 [Streptococcus agalactiae MRI Z1-024]
MDESIDDKFKEKIATIIIQNQENGQILNTANGTESYPALISLNCQVDFFNIKPDTDYVFEVIAIFSVEGESILYPLYKSNVNVPKEFLSFETIEGYGKVSASFNIELYVKNPSDCYIQSSLFNNPDEDVLLDEKINYFYFKQLGGTNDVD